MYRPGHQAGDGGVQAGGRDQEVVAGAEDPGTPPGIGEDRQGRGRRPGVLGRATVRRLGQLPADRALPVHPSTKTTRAGS